MKRYTEHMDPHGLDGALLDLLVNVSSSQAGQGAAVQALDVGCRVKVALAIYEVEGK